MSRPKKKSRRASDKSFDFLNRKNQIAPRDDEQTRAEKDRLINEYLEKQKMTAPFQWRNGTLKQLLNLHKSKYSTRQIADRMGMSRETIRTKLVALDLRENIPKKLSTITKSGTEPRPHMEPVRFPRFEDHPNGDRDKNFGRKPSREISGSLVGCAALLCVS